MRIFKKIGAWFIQNEVDLAEGYRQQYHQTLEELKEVNEERNFLAYERARLSDKIKEQEQTISELKDEIDIQRAKAAKYLSFYLQEMEKHAPND